MNFLYHLQDGGIHILAAPVIQSDGTLTAVLELYRLGKYLNLNHLISHLKFNIS
jgi:hypothetical protein